VLLLVLASFAAAAVAPIVHRLMPKISGYVLALAPAGMAAYLLQLAPRVASEGGFESTSVAWAPSLDIHFVFYLDGLSLAFGLLISGIGALIVCYTGGYLHGHKHEGRFQSFMFLFMGSMLGVVLAGNLITLFVFWELTSLTSFLLIGFEYEKKESRYAAIQALVVTGFGGLILLAGLILLGQVAGTYTLAELLTKREAIQESTLYLPILVLVLAGAVTKSAQFPFHFWLPNAMAAPTPASAYLHSSTMVKAGVYLLARMHPVLGGTEAWTYSVTAFGAATFFVGGYLALRESILKRLLAYSTVSGLGTLVMLIGLGTKYALEAAMVFLLVHAFYKAALFMVAGAIDHETGERDITKLGGLRRAMPITAIAAAVAALSMAGVPFFFGFIGKELVYETLYAKSAVYPLVALAVVSNMAMVAVAGWVAFKPFLGAVVATPKSPHEAPLSMWLGPVVLGVLSFVAGWYFKPLEHYLIAPGTAAILGEPAEIHLALWHGFSPVLVLSAVTLLGGVGLYLVKSPVVRALAILDPLHRNGPAKWYDWVLNGLTAVACWVTRYLQSGYLRYYMAITVLTTVGLALYALWGRDALVLPETWTPLRGYETGLCLLILASTVAAVHSRTRLAAVAALGVVGYAVGLLYVLFGAPDLAMTQIVVETLTVILFVLAFYHLPGFAYYSSKTQRLRDAIIAGGMGLLMTLLVLAAQKPQGTSHVAQYYLSKSYLEAHGRNIVNVILVDFRGIDTMGEITVLAVAGLGAYSLLKLRKGERVEK
jgi:multicomponent Na+:H+ antiporter subunit A